MKYSKKGIATFEWILLITFLVIGIIGGLAVMRDSLIIECAETADAVLHHNKSYFITPSVVADIKFAMAGSGAGGVMGTQTGSYTGATRYTDPVIPADTSAIVVKAPETKTE